VILGTKIVAAAVNTPGGAEVALNQTAARIDLSDRVILGRSRR
jgi:hypothetical protein